MLFLAACQCLAAMLLPVAPPRAIPACPCPPLPPAHARLMRISRPTRCRRYGASCFGSSRSRSTTHRRSSCPTRCSKNFLCVSGTARSVSGTAICFVPGGVPLLNMHRTDPHGLRVCRRRRLCCSGRSDSTRRPCISTCIGWSRWPSTPATKSICQPCWSWSWCNCWWRYCARCTRPCGA